MKMFAVPPCSSYVLIACLRDLIVGAMTLWRPSLYTGHWMVMCGRTPERIRGGGLAE